MESVLAQLSETVTAASSLEELTRPMLEMLEAVTGLESTYLTTIDQAADVQHILFSRNAGELNVREGAEISWTDSLCRRALDSDLVHVSDVASRWPEVGLAVHFGIQSYFSMPISTQSGGFYGTLCGLSTTPLPEKSNAELVLRLFAQLIAQHLEREFLFERLQGVNAELASRASTDALTGLPNRRSLLDALRRMLATGQRDARSVLVGFIDLDGFKAINDQYGHDVGDEFLTVMAARIGVDLREGDMLARIGGDEFVVIGLGPVPEGTTGAATVGAATAALSRRLDDCTVGRFALSTCTIDYAGASVGVVSIEPGSTTAEEALRQADVQMYDVKRERKARQAATTL